MDKIVLIDSKASDEVKILALNQLITKVRELEITVDSLEAYDKEFKYTHKDELRELGEDLKNHFDKSIKENSYATYETIKKLEEKVTLLDEKIKALENKPNEIIIGRWKWFKGICTKAFEDYIFKIIMGLIALWVAGVFTWAALFKK